MAHFRERTAKCALLEPIVRLREREREFLLKQGMFVYYTSAVR